MPQIFIGPFLGKYMSTALSIVLDLEVFILKEIIRVNMMTMHAKTFDSKPKDTGSIPQIYRGRN